MESSGCSKEEGVGIGVMYNSKVKILRCIFPEGSSYPADCCVHMYVAVVKKIIYAKYHIQHTEIVCVLT